MLMLPRCLGALSRERPRDTPKIFLWNSKCVERILSVHEAQTLIHLRLSGCRFGLLMNFDSVMLKDGLRRRARADLRAFDRVVARAGDEPPRPHDAKPPEW